MCERAKAGMSTGSLSQGTLYKRERLSAVGLLVLTAFDNANIIYFLAKQATLLSRSIVLSISLQLVFPGFVESLIKLPP